MSILVERASLEDRARFFRKNQSTITRLLGDLAEPAKKPKRKKKAKAKAKEKPKAKAKVKAKAKPKPKAKTKEKEKPKPKAKAKPKVEEKDLSVEVPVTDNVIEAPVLDTPTTEEACASTNTPDDLTKISGLGAKMVENLNAAGISTFEQVANLSKTQITQLGKSIRGFAANYKRKDFKKQAQEFNQ